MAELHAPFSHQELILRRALGLGDDVAINPSGGALAGNPMFTAGLIRIGEAARRVWDGSADKVLGHATSGPALQQNLVCVAGRTGLRWASCPPPSSASARPTTAPSARTSRWPGCAARRCDRALLDAGI